ncbi:MAG: hypothetical protein KatS3mg114_0177 [Planctomycetaceae bacterium]|nr:MAG: hypothetical protein KatS3mg114_0177 [Planctomycetaceae bacterium]
MRTQDPSEVTDRPWQILEKLLTPLVRRGRPPLDRRWVLNAILFVVRTGCQWRQLPRDFPPWKSVYTVFGRWRIAGVGKLVHE